MKSPRRPAEPTTASPSAGAGRLVRGTAGVAVAAGVLLLGSGAAWAGGQGQGHGQHSNGHAARHAASRTTEVAPAGHHPASKGSRSSAGKGAGGSRSDHGGSNSGTGKGAGGPGSGHAGGGSAPPGNNGTIKIDQTVLVASGRPDHANHPHVTCEFALSFFGYDTGTDTAQVSFAAQPPSGKFTPVQPTTGPSDLTFTVPARTGGGQLDTSVNYVLDVAGLSQQSQQGYHISVTVDVSGSIGADAKHKVFWYEPCSGTTTSTGSPKPAAPGPTGSGSGAATSPGGSTAAAHIPASLTSSSSVAARTGLAGTAAADTPVTAASGVLPLGAGTDLGRFSPSSPASPFVGFWEIVGGSALLAAALSMLLVERARRRARA